MTPETTRLGRGLYWAGKAFFLTAYRTIWRLRAFGQENIPRTGGLIIASNHLSLADPQLVGCCIPRMIHFMAKQELFDVPLFGPLLRQVNAFPVSRGEGDVGAFKKAFRILNGGGAIIMFPEGTRQKGGILGKPKPGVGLLAGRTGCPVVPAYVHNSDRMAAFAPLRVRFGVPLRPAPGTDHAGFSARVMESIGRLKEATLGS